MYVQYGFRICVHPLLGVIGLSMWQLFYILTKIITFPKLGIVVTLA